MRLTFGKSQLKKLFHSDFPQLPAPSPAPLVSELDHCPSGLKQYVVVSNAGVLQPPNGVQPLFIGPTPAPVPMAVPVPVPVSLPPAGWTPGAAPRGSSPHVPAGTGVFLPPSGPGLVSPWQHECNRVEKPHGYIAASPKTRTKETGTVPDRNGVRKGEEENIAAQRPASNQATVSEAK